MKQVASGRHHVCAILNDDSVKCWGRNDLGQLGNGVVDLGTGKKAKQISASGGGDHTCAILNDDTVKCWGRNSYGQVNTGNLGTAKRISAGVDHTCAILDDDTVKCWGYGGDGRLGYENSDNLNGPPSSTVDLGTGKKAKEIFAANTHTCAILNDDTVKCWGDGNLGKLGYGDERDRGDGANEMGDNLPVVNLGTGKTAKQMALGNIHTCAILNDDTVKCWGHGDYGELGLGGGNDNNQYSPPSQTVNLGTGKTAKVISAGARHTCAILNDNTVKCWGYNQDRMLGYDIDTVRFMGDNLPAVDLGISSELVTSTHLNHLIGLQSNSTHLNVLKGASTDLGKAELDLLVGLDVNAGDLNVMKGVSSSLNASELSRLVGLTAEASELNVLSGVNSALNSTHLGHLIGLQSNASHLNVLKDVSTDLGKAELDLLVGLDVNAGDLNVMKGVSSSLKANELGSLVGLTAEASELNVLSGIKIASYPKVGSEFVVNTQTNGNQENPSSATLSSGEVIVVWGDSGNNGNYGQRFDSKGDVIGSQFKINTNGNYLVII